MYSRLQSQFLCDFSVQRSVAAATDQFISVLLADDDGGGGDGGAQ